MFLSRELAVRKPSTHRMLAQGVTVLGDPGDLPARCARVLAQGPPSLSAAERDRFRYGLTDLLDDYTHAVDPGERSVIASVLWLEAARAALAFGGSVAVSGFFANYGSSTLLSQPVGRLPVTTRHSSRGRFWPAPGARCSTATEPRLPTETAVHPATDRAHRAAAYSDA